MIAVTLMNGILIIDKPTGLSSHACVGRIRRVYGTKKVGHSGTLDVAASGVLVLGINQGTKLLSYLNQDDKTYRFGIRFGQETDTLDHTGVMTRVMPIESIAMLDTILAGFIGPQFQTVPAYAAVKVNGMKLYEYARRGLLVPKTAPRPMTIYALKRVAEVIEVESGFETVLEMCVSKGFYIRQFAQDLAAKLNTVAHTTSIRRLQAGSYTIDEAVALEAVQANTPLITPTEALRDMPEVFVLGTQSRYVSHGRAIELNQEAPLLKVMDQAGNLLAIYEKTTGQQYRPRHVFMPFKSEETL